MSHVFDTKLVIKDLDCLAKACEQIGLELVIGQTTYKWYGHHVGDYPLPAGYSVSDMGKCVHACRVKDNTSAYEVGVCARRDGQQGWALIFDFYAGGRGLCAKVGNIGEILKSAYTEQVARKQLATAGLKRLKRTKLADGRVLMEYVK